MTAATRKTSIDEVRQAVLRAEQDAAETAARCRMTSTERNSQAYNHLLGALSVLCGVDIDAIRAEITGERAEKIA